MHRNGLNSDWNSLEQVCRRDESLSSVVQKTSRKRRNREGEWMTTRNIQAGPRKGRGEDNQQEG